MDIKKEKFSDAGISSQEDPIGKVTGFFLFRNLISSYSSDKNAEDNERKNIKNMGLFLLYYLLLLF